MAFLLEQVRWTAWTILAVCKQLDQVACYTVREASELLEKRTSETYSLLFKSIDLGK